MKNIKRIFIYLIFLLTCISTPVFAWQQDHNPYEATMIDYAVGCVRWGPQYLSNSSAKLASSGYGGGLPLIGNNTNCAPFISKWHASGFTEKDLETYLYLQTTDAPMQVYLTTRNTWQFETCQKNGWFHWDCEIYP